MGKNASKICEQVRDSTPCSETHHPATSKLSVDLTQAVEKNEKDRFPSTLRVDHSSSTSLGENRQEQLQQQPQEPSAVCPDGVTLRLASALHDALIRGDGSSSTSYLEPGSLVEFTVQLKRTSIPAAEPLKKESNADPLKKERKADPLKKERKADPLKKERKADPLKKESNAEPHIKKKPPRACCDRRQQCVGAADVSQCIRQSRVGNWPPASSNDATASVRRPQPIGGDVMPTGLPPPHVRHVTGGPTSPADANPSAADVYRYYRRLQRQRERSSRVAAAWVAGNNHFGNVGSVDQPAGMLYYGNPPLKRTEGDGAERRDLF